jgi:hypothetical protein
MPSPLLPTILLLALLALPGAGARVAFQLAIDWEKPGRGFPGLLKGFLYLVASVSLGLTFGLLCLSVPKFHGWEFAAAVGVGFAAQDVFVFLEERLQRYRQNPKALIEDIEKLKK